MKAIILIIAVALLSGCSATWHVKQAYRKDPSLFDTIVVRVVKPMEVPEVTTNFDCFELMKAGEIVLYSPVLITNPVTGEVNEDSVRLQLTVATDSTGQATSQIAAAIDCPDAEVIYETRIIPPIVVQPSFWDKAKWGAIGFAISILAFLLLNIILPFLRK